MKLIDSYRSWYRMWSIQLAALAGMIAASIMADPSLVLGLVAYIPKEWRGLAAVLTGLVTFVLPAVTRLTQQSSPAAKADDSVHPAP